MTVSRSIERALCIFSIKLAFFSAVTPGSALIRLITTSLVVSLSCGLNNAGVEVADCPPLGVAVSLGEIVGFSSGEGAGRASADVAGLAADPGRASGKPVPADKKFSFPGD